MYETFTYTQGWLGMKHSHGDMCDACAAGNGSMNGAYQETSSKPPFEKQNEKAVQWRLNLHQIGLDVVRTDRMLQYYASQQHMSKLWDILAVYCWLDPAIGYCQGENSPLLSQESLKPCVSLNRSL